VKICPELAVATSFVALLEQATLIQSCAGAVVACQVWLAAMRATQQRPAETINPLNRR
jgi:hypothetical protein